MFCQKQISSLTFIRWLHRAEDPFLRFIALDQKSQTRTLKRAEKGILLKRTKKILKKGKCHQKVFKKGSLLKKN